LRFLLPILRRRRGLDIPRLLSSLSRNNVSSLLRDV
jgi:hypothetical protein